MAANKIPLLRELAAERIGILFELATAEPDRRLANRYARLIVEIGRHYRVRLPKEIKRSICKKCGSVLVPGKGVEIRIASSKRYVVYRCTNCGTEKHLPY